MDDLCLRNVGSVSEKCLLVYFLQVFSEDFIEKFQFIR